MRKVISIFYIISLGVLSLLKSQDIVDIIATLLLICIGLKGINQKGTLYGCDDDTFSPHYML